MTGFRIPGLKPLKQGVCCCCICSLQRAALVVGYVSLILSVLHLLQQLMTGKINPAPTSSPVDIPVSSKGVVITGIVITAYKAIISLLLVLGASAEVESIMVTYVILELINIIGGICFAIYLGCTISDATFLAVMIIVCVIALGIEVYLWLVPYSYYRQLVERNSPQYSMLSNLQSSPQSYPQSSPPSSPQNNPQSFPPSSPQNNPQSFPPSYPQNNPQSFPPSSPQNNPQSFPPSSPQNNPQSFPSSSPQNNPQSFPPSSPQNNPQSFPPSYPQNNPQSSLLSFPQDNSQINL